MSILTENIGADIVILAAGQGTRMASPRPKVMHPVGGRSMLAHVVDLALDIVQQSSIDNPHNIVVVHAPDQNAIFQAEIEAECGEKLRQTTLATLHFAMQTERLGTAHALRTGLDVLDKRRPTLMLYSDQPLMPAAKLFRMLQGAAQGFLVSAAFNAADPTGYGRVLIDPSGHVQQIIEDRDANTTQKGITLCNGGVMAIPACALELIAKIDNNNVAQEYYITDLAALAMADNILARVQYFSEDEMSAVNTLAQLATAEQIWQHRKRLEMMQTGVQLIAPDSVYFSVDTQIAAGSTIEPNVHFGRDVRIKGPSLIRAFSHLDGTHMGAGCQIGPFARLRPDTRIADDVRVGNFVEVKKSKLHNSVRVNHLTYLGDATVEKNVNLGAGVITCNYDGVNKNQTVIRENTFVGSNASLVAPLVIAENSMIGAGSVITENNSPGELSLSRTKQIDIRGGTRRAMQRNLERKKSDQSKDQ